MERRARAHASKRRRAHKHPRLPLLLQFHPLRSLAGRARIGPTLTGLHRRGSARVRGKGRERRADHLPHPLPHRASKRCRRRSFCTHPHRALAGGPRLRPLAPRRESASTDTGAGRAHRSRALSPLGARPGPAAAPRRPPNASRSRAPAAAPRHRCSPPLLELGHPPARRTRRRLDPRCARILRSHSVLPRLAYSGSSRVYGATRRIDSRIICSAPFPYAPHSARLPPT